MITWKKHFIYLADYQYWANETLFESLDHLTDAARKSDQGLYFVRFVDTKEAAKDEPNFFTRWFTSDDPAKKALNRYRIQVKAEGTGTLVSVLNFKGEADNSESAQKIVSLLVDELKQ